MTKIRTIEQAYAEIKEKDPYTALSKYKFRSMVESGEIPSMKSGVKTLVDMDTLEKHLSTFFIEEERQ